MTVSAQISEGPVIIRAELLARVASLTSLIEEFAAESEAQGTLAPEVVAALRQAGLFGLWSAGEVGGYDIDLVDQLEIRIEKDEKRTFYFSYQGRYNNWTKGQLK